jgi:hypothetical protein
MYQFLTVMEAPEPFLEWVKINPSYDLFEAWDKCPRGDWLLWLHHKLKPNHRALHTKARAVCANSLRHVMDDRSKIAVDLALAYATEAQLKSVRKTAAAVMNGIRNDPTRYIAAWAAWSLTIPYEPERVFSLAVDGMPTIETRMADAIREVLSL